jgi:hypothetical protein
MKKYELEKQRRLQSIEARVARHKTVIHISVMVVVLFAGLALILLASFLFDNAAQTTK